MRSRSGNLPAEVTSFVGRLRESAELVRVVRKVPLVTLTGVGGVGKTRLALRVAKLTRGLFPDGVWLVELSHLHDPHLLPHTVTAALGVGTVSTSPPLEVLADFLRHRQLLLVLDTCEHLIDACAELVKHLHHAAPGLVVLATSRRPLGLPEELQYPIQPLPADDALALLTARAPENAHTPDAPLLCRRLEGIPLAIELAAVRLRTLSPAQIVERLDDRFHLLLGGQGSPERHQTLLTAIGWSHELCEPLERLLWARLSVFAGEFDLDAAQTVCADHSLDRARVEGLLRELVAKSILTALPGGRFVQLDTLREYGAGWLRRLGENGLMRLAHRDYFLGLARQFNAEWFGPDQPAWCARMRRELPNLRAAIELCLSDTAEQDLGLDLVANLGYLWMAGGHNAEGRHHLARALALADNPPASVRHALWVGAWLANFQGDLDDADELATECVTRAIPAGDHLAAGWGVACSAITAIYLGRINESLELYRRAEELHAQATPREAGLSYALLGQAFTLLQLGRSKEAQEILARQRRLSVARGEVWLDSYGDWIRSLIELDHGHPAEADKYARDALWVKQRLFDALGMGTSLTNLAASAAQLGDNQRAARLLGILALVEHTYGLRLNVSQLQVLRKRTERDITALIGHGAFATAYMDGFSMTMDEAIRYALGAK
ncbi:ATP-binding protein [Nonomuraea sp. NPDC050663]|uniref:ATP-binding protein n=1 Tax=Nonomuraea sp. NPDC050663 TaxID=3364370 RepID=UPI00379AD472